MQGAVGISAMWFPAAILLRRLAGDDSGATSVEYAVLGGSLALAILVGIDTVGGGLSALLNTVATTAF